MSSTVTPLMHPVLNITTIAVEPPPVGGLDLISAKVLQQPSLCMFLTTCQMIELLQWLLYVLRTRFVQD